VPNVQVGKFCKEDKAECVVAPLWEVLLGKDKAQYVAPRVVLLGKD
jgi:hypothetical protein